MVYIFDSALEETAINEKLARFSTLIQQPGSEPPQVSHWGKRTLAYPIKRARQLALLPYIKGFTG